MNCTEAELYVSALYDGERIPLAAAQHIAGCGPCHRLITDYAHMGAELRLSASVQPIKLLPRKRGFDVLWARVPVPRFALVALIACTVLATTALSMLRAQSRPLWFEFGFGFHEGREVFDYTVAKKGDDKTAATVTSLDGELVAAALRLKVERVSRDDVVLRCRAVSAKMGITSAGAKLLGPQRRVSLDSAPTVHYKPGESLAIPIEGGGTLYLKGDVLDHQPKIAFGFPLEPAAEKLVVRSPVLVASGHVLADFNGATAVATDQSRAIYLGAGSNGNYTFALRPFPGATQGELNWGEIIFKRAGEKYRLISAAPITGGDQPRRIWVRHDTQSDSQLSLGAIQIPD
jgi:hypothetical protein